MSDYNNKIAQMNDQLLSDGDVLKDSQIILIALGELGSCYESFKTSIISRFDHSMSFDDFSILLSDYETSLEPSPEKVTAQANIVTKAARSEVSGKATVVCQICSKKNHNALNGFNRINLLKFAPQHKRPLSPLGPGQVSEHPSVNYAGTRGGAMACWYPEKGSTYHITSISRNLQISSPDESLDNSSVLTATASSQKMKVDRFGDFVGCGSGFHLKIKTDAISVP